MELLQTIFSNLWAVFLVILFFGGSIFVHELGHFLAARRRGVHVERFSIGFGPKIFSWHGKDGVEYRLSWFPLGGYVALPQLADMSAIEGKSTQVNLSEGGSGSANRALPPITYATKVIVFAAGAAFNVIFAFLLACIVWVIGLPESSEQNSTQLGYISPTLKLADKTEVPSPAFQAQLKVGDIVRAIDGKRVDSWSDIQTFVGLGADHSSDGQRRAIFTIERDGQVRDITVYPQLAGDESDRRVGIAPGYPLLVGDLKPNSAAARAGFKTGDEIISVDGARMLNSYAFEKAVVADDHKSLAIVIRREKQDVPLTLQAAPTLAAVDSLGFSLTTVITMGHPSPFSQIEEQVVMMYRSLAGLINPHSDVGPSKMVSPVGIIRIYFNAAESGIRAVLWFTILINVNLAMFNLLPVPVLDGGHILFATIARLRGRPLPIELIATAQSVFMVLLLCMVLYVGFFDVRRITRDHRADKEASNPVAQPAPSTPEHAAPLVLPTPVPVKP
jgi:regulator of sigma E protease